MINFAMEEGLGDIGSWGSWCLDAVGSPWLEEALDSIVIVARSLF